MTKTSRYIVYGAGEDAIILVHGFLATSHYWDKVTPGLVKAGFRVIAVNLLGFGNASKPHHIEYGYDDQVEYLQKIIIDLKLTSPVNLVGHSMGALIIARFARLYPDLVKSAVLIHPPIYRNTTEARETLISTGKAYRYLLGSHYRNIGWKALRTVLPQTIASHTQFSRERSLENIVLKSELISDLNLTTTNTLLIVGLKDRPIYLENLRHIVSNLSVEVAMEDVGHHSPVKSPALIQQHILTFIQTH